MEKSLIDFYEINMRLLFAINNLCAGGAERVLSALVSELSKNETIDIHIVCCHSEDKFAYFYHVPEFVPIHLIDYGDIDQLKNVILHIGPEVVISFLNPMNHMCSVASHMVGVPHIACERNNPYMSPYRDEDRKKRDDAFCKAEGCVFQTEKAVNYFSGKLIGLHTIIDNPVCNNVNPALQLAENGINKIVTVGRYAEQKNYYFLIDVFCLFRTKHPEFILECYGKDSGEYKKINQYIIDKGMEGCILLKRETPYVHNCIASAKAFLFTPFFEGTPNALMEAAAIGIPCVASDLPEIRSINHPNPFAILCPLNNKELFVKALESVIFDKHLASSLVSNGQIMAQLRDIRNIAQRWLAFILTVINKQ